MRTFSPARAAFVIIILCSCFVALGTRVAYLQTYGRQQTIGRAERQQHQNQVLRSRRGSIFDANSMLMAGTVQTQTLYVDPKFMQQVYEGAGRSLVQMDDDVAALARLIDKEPFEISKLLSDRATSRFVKVAENLDEPTCRAIHEMNLPGVGLLPESARTYPMGSIAAHVLGGSGKDGNGLEGIELKFNKVLSGKDGQIRVLKDARRRAIATAADDYVPPLHGKHVVLTIDANIQMIVEQELADTCTKYRAQRGEAVVMNPTTGDVLALANWPTFNPQNLEDSTADRRRNRVLTDPYEPGSTFKPFITGPALALGVTRVNEVFPTGGKTWRTPYNRTITDVHGYDRLALWDVLVKSSNIGMAMLSERMGNPRLYKAITSFGFGRPTGIELPGEDRGTVHPLNKWTKFSTDSVAQGYEVMVTPMQLARAFCAYANGGRLITPRLVKGVLDSEGNIIARPTKPNANLLPEVIDPTSAAWMRRVMCDVMIRGTGSGARSRTWNVFGKTGTAHISQGLAGYAADKYTSSFIGGAPAEKPELVIAFIIHEPDRAFAVKNNMSYFGGAVAAPGAVASLERALAYLQVPPSPDITLPPPHVASVLFNYNPKQYAKPKPKTEKNEKTVATVKE
ncbi:MAG TPA: penicillin-binding protein 2 [Tepidisphaeraceae bacterium]|jgi:cell division protein FtsI/penicillin-binding protein 2|nr:penicillin-binding protein 2 [Tepidisphaeraceae bacterium]